MFKLESVKGFIESNPLFAIAIIIVLIVVVVYMYVTQYGFMWLKPKNSDKKGKLDVETEKLIDAINSA